MQRLFAACFTSVIAGFLLIISSHAIAAISDDVTPFSVVQLPAMSPDTAYDRSRGDPKPHAWSCTAPYETPTWTQPADDGVALSSLLEASGYGSPSNSNWVDLAAGNFCGGSEKELVLLKNRHSYLSILRGPAPYAVGSGDLDSSSSHPWRAVAAGNLHRGPVPGHPYDHIVAVRKVSARGVPDLVVAKASDPSCEVATEVASAILGNPSNSEWVDAAVGNFDGKGNVIALVKAKHSNFFFVRLTSENKLEVFHITDLDSSAERPWRALAAGDIDGDGVDELIAARQVSDHRNATVLAYKWTGSGFALFATSTFGNNGNSNWTSAAVGDFNADGRKAIVLVKNAHSNFVALDLPPRARELRVLATADLDSASGQNWRGLAATDWLANDQGASELVAVRAATGRYRTDLFVYGNPFHRVPRDTGLAETRAQWSQVRSDDTERLKEWLTETHTNSLSWSLMVPRDYPRLVRFLEDTKNFCVDGRQLRVSVTLWPRPNEDYCSLPEESDTTWSEAPFFPGGLTTDSCDDFLGWSSLIGRLAQDYPHLVALGIDDFSHYMGEPPFTEGYMAQFVSRMRAQAPWLNFVPTAYYSDFYTRVFSPTSPPVYIAKWPDITRTFDTMIYYFRNEKKGTCLSGSCGEKSVRNAPEELIEMSKLLPAGRKLQLGMYFGTHSKLGKGTPRYAFDLVNLGLNLPWIGGTTAYPMQTPKFMCDELNFLDDILTEPEYDRKFCVLWKAYGRKPQYVTYQDLTNASGARHAAGDPFGYAFPAQGVQNIVYRATNGHAHQLWRTATSIGHSDLSAAAGAPSVNGDPKTYVFAATGLQNVLYRGSDGHLHRLFGSTGPVMHDDDLTARSHAPRPAGNPFGYVVDSTQHAVYRRADGHLHALNWTDGVVGHDDLTTRSHAPMAVGNPFAYVVSAAGEQNVVYGGTNGHLHRLFWTNGAVAREDLTAQSQAPNSAADPTAYVASAQGLQNVVYRGTDGRLHRLFWSTGSVDHQDLSNSVRAPSPTGVPAAYFVADDGTHHVIFRGADNHLHELSWTVGVVTHNDLTALATAPGGPAPPSAAGSPSAYFNENDGTHHVIYRSSNGHLHELRWSN